jgi:hypothetical protein
VFRDNNFTRPPVVFKDNNYDTWIYNYLCSQCLSPLKLWIWISHSWLGVLDTTLCDKVCQWDTAGIFSINSQTSVFYIPNLYFISQTSVFYIPNLCNLYPKSESNLMLNRKIIETGKINTHNKHMHDLSLSWLGTGTSVKVEGLD